MPDITIQHEAELSAEEFLDVLHRSGLAERRPANDPERIAAWLTARDHARRTF